LKAWIVSRGPFRKPGQGPDRPGTSWASAKMSVRISEFYTLNGFSGLYPRGKGKEGSKKSDKGKNGAPVWWSDGHQNVADLAAGLYGPGGAKGKMNSCLYSPASIVQLHEKGKMDKGKQKGKYNEKGEQEGKGYGKGEEKGKYSEKGEQEGKGYNKGKPEGDEKGMYHEKGMQEGKGYGKGEEKAKYSEKGKEKRK
jgi:hypothetical protein